MRVYEIRGGFGLDNLRMAERPTPQAGPGEVLVKLGAASFNFRDLMTIKGTYNPKQPLPLVPCSDGAGTVAAVGKGVTRVKEGDRVAGCFAQRWTSGEPTSESRGSTLGGPLDGTLAEYAVWRENGVVATPPHLSDEEAAHSPAPP